MVPSTAILYYDFALTLVSEIEFFWTSANWSIISVLFVVNRYFGLIGAIPLGFEYFGTASEHVSAVDIASSSLWSVIWLIPLPPDVMNPAEVVSISADHNF